jgi:starch phosphorylase
MAYLAIRASGWVNGVSRLHAEVSRRLFQPLFPRLPASEVPVSHVTNGIHVPSWDGREADRLWTDLCGRRPWRGDQAGLEERVRSADDERIWRMRSTGRAALVDYARHRLSRQEAAYGAAGLRQQRVQRSSPPTLGLRRFATYKRATLLLEDLRWLEQLLCDERGRSC